MLSSDDGVMYMPLVKVNWSGGKDSTCAVLKHLESGNEVVAVCYVPMFDEETPLLLKEHYDFLHYAASQLRQRGAQVYFVHGQSYTHFVTHVTTRGKYKGKIFGFPCYLAGRCNFQKASKYKALTSFMAPVWYDFEDIGIAFDETARQAQLTEKKRSILCELGIDERTAQEICRENGLLSPLYNLGIKRDGCTLCPHAKPEVRERWFSDYPGTREKLLALQEIVRIHRPDRPPLRGKQYFI